MLRVVVVVVVVVVNSDFCPPMSLQGSIPLPSAPLPSLRSS